MRTWWKKIGVLAGGLISLGCLASAVAAQGPGGQGPTGPGPAGQEPSPPARSGGMLSRLFGGGKSDGPCPPDFPNPGRGPSGTESPFTLKEGTPSAFNDLDCAPVRYAYGLTVRTEALGWWVGRANVPAPLVTTSTAPNLVNNFGAIGQSNTQVLIGPPGQSYGLVYGGRATIGIAPGFLPPMEISGLFLNRNLDPGGGSPLPVLARPVGLLNQTTLVGAPSQSVYLAGFPGVGSGHIDVQSNFNLWAVDLDTFFNIVDNGVVQMDLIGGYKHAELHETLSISNTFAANRGEPFNGQIVPAGFSTGVVDQFTTRNQFDGATFGVRTRILNGGLMLMADTKLSAGNTHAASDLRGFSTLFGGGGSLTVPGGILIGPSNGGGLARNRFAVIPEANVNLSYQLTNNLRIFVGYSALYWSSVGRAGDQVNTSVDPRQVPTDRSFIPGFRGIGPTPHLTTTGFFAHGVNAGFEVGF